MDRVVNVNDFDARIITHAPVLERAPGNAAGQGKKHYLDLVCALDIETTTVNTPAGDNAIMYIWQLQVDDICTVIGRYWEELYGLLETVSKALDDYVYLCIYVYNLSFEFQFLRDGYDFRQRDVFALAPRKVLRATMYDHIDLRCAYLLTGTSLDKFLSDMNVPHLKLTMDYNVKRYPWTELTPDELAYCVNDVRGLVEALKVLMSVNNDTLYTIPSTVTGYVRRDIKAVMRTVDRRWLTSLMPDIYVYKLLREAFRGGDTHASRWYVASPIEGVHRADRSSAYPAAMCMEQYPCSPWTVESELTVDRLEELMFKRGKALLIRLQLWGIRLRDMYDANPYISLSKTRGAVKATVDNGRVMGAEYLEITVTDIDYRLISDQYEWRDIEIDTMLSARYGRLPRQLRDKIHSYYVRKTELKGVEGSELDYMQAKRDVNSIYGLSAQDPIKQRTLYVDGVYIEDDADIEGLLAKHNGRAAMPYTWSLWVTAWSRYRLREGVTAAGDGWVYGDTDSIYYIDTDDTTLDIDKLNAETVLTCERDGWYADDRKGNRHYMGAFEREPDVYQFATLGAKKYVYRRHHCFTLDCTIAGVNKLVGGIETELSGGINRFCEAYEEGRELMYRAAGGNDVVYIDEPATRYVDIDGHKVRLTSNVVIKPGVYTLGVGKEYRMLIDDPHRVADIVKWRGVMDEQNSINEDQCDTIDPADDR